MQKQKQLLRIFLFIGILLFAIGIITRIFFYHGVANDIGVSQEKLLEKLRIIPPVFLFLIIGIIMPVIEEFIFRSWTITKKIGRNKIWLIILCILSSLFFGIAHIPNESSLILKIAAFLQITGVGLILAFAALRFHFIWAIIGHVANNLIALLLNFCFVNTTFTDSDFTATLSPISIFSTTFPNDYCSKDSINLYGYPADIAVAIAPQKTDIQYIAHTYTLQKYHLVATAHNSDSINNHKLLQSYLKYMNIVADTMLQSAYLVYVEDEAKFNKQQDGKAMIMLESLIFTFQRKYNIALVFPNSIRNTILYMDTDFFTIKDYTKAKLYLREHHGLLIEDTPTQQVQCVHFLPQ